MIILIALSLGEDWERLVFINKENVISNKF